MWCLTLATNAIVTWTTEYYGLAVAALHRGGRPLRVAAATLSRLEGQA
jgi:hypothetical protein